jgi:hypothetical protein
MGYNYDHKLITYFKFQKAWCKWLSQEPSAWRLIKYIKWRLNEPKYEDFVKENNHDLYLSRKL